MLISGKLIKRAIELGAVRVAYITSETNAYRGQVIRYHFLRVDNVCIAQYDDDLHKFFPAAFEGQKPTQWHTMTLAEYQTRNLADADQYQDETRYDLRTHTTGGRACSQS